MTTDYWNELKAKLASCADYEARLDQLRVFAREQKLAIQERDLRGSLPLTGVFAELTALAEAVLRGSLETAWGGIAEHGRGDFAIVGMGKFGGRELTYRSDLDILYIYENADDQEFYTRLGTRIISALSVITREGIAYAIDTALRPSGNRGTLVSSLASFQDYHRTMGKTWERQALIKSRPLFGRPDGSADFCRRLRDSIEDIAYQDYDAPLIALEIDHLRGRMEKEIAREKPGRYNLKTGRGGIVDIEFAVQYLQLVHGKKHPKIRNQNTLSALEALAGEEILESSLAKILERSYLFLRGIETRLRLHLDQPADDIVEGAEWLLDLERLYFKGENILPQLLRTRGDVRSAYERVMKK